MGNSESRMNMEAKTTGTERKSNSSMASLEMARQIRADQGNFEAEVTCEGEADLHRHFTSCEKNPDHRQFFPVNDFKKEHLPFGYRDDDTINYIKAQADLTVRVCVNHISENRPETFPEMKGPFKSHSGEPYPFSNYKGAHFTTTGTGHLHSVSLKSTDKGNGLCPCSSCESSSSSTPRQQWGELEIWTAKHVVFDDDEARDTTCDFFYDSNDSVGVVRVEGVRMVDSELKYDMSKFTCVTHNMDLVKQFKKMFRHREYLRRQVGNRFAGFFVGIFKRKKLAFLVSHPHGCPKQVSVGEWIGPVETFFYHNYTAATCPGSSGAPAFSVGRGWLPLTCHHSCITDMDGVNMCGGFGLIGEFSAKILSPPTATSDDEDSSEDFCN